MNETNPKYKVFLIDDDKFLLDMYALKFTKNGAVIEFATNGADMIKKLEGGYVPDVVVIDVVMPGMSGLETIEEVRKKKLIENVPVVVLSNQSQNSDFDKAKSLGVKAYIVKASTIPSEVVEQVTRIINESKK
ncbi:MAG: response regulator [Candidatus Paceibacterota bacterium]